MTTIACRINPSFKALGPSTYSFLKIENSEVLILHSEINLLLQMIFQNRKPEIVHFCFTVTTCPIIPILQNGTITCSAGNSVGSHCNLTCAPGRTHIGSYTRTCLAPGVWTGRLTYCAESKLSTQLILLQFIHSCDTNYFNHV